MFTFRIFFLIITLPIWLYMYFTAKRGVLLFVDKDKSRLVNVLSAKIGGFLSLPMMFIFDGLSTLALLLVHFAVFTALTQLADFTIKRISKKQYKTWNYIYRLCVIPILCIALLFSFGYVNMKNIRKTVYTVNTDKDISSYKAALLADIHYGTSVDESDIMRIARDISSEKVDFVILCGDITDESTSFEGLNQVYSALGSIDTVYGVFAVLGNHDRQLYSSNPKYSTEALKEIMKKNGIILLEDEMIQLGDNFYLAGRKDFSDKRRLSVERLISNANNKAFVFVADHQPVEFEEKANAGADIQVSGHTHGGQIFPLAYINTLVSKNDLCYGNQKYGNMTAIVTSGLSGWGFSVRTQGISEYVIISIEGKG